MLNVRGGERDVNFPTLPRVNGEGSIIGPTMSLNDTNVGSNDEGSIINTTMSLNDTNIAAASGAAMTWHEIHDKLWDEFYAEQKECHDRIQQWWSPSGGRGFNSGPDAVKELNRRFAECPDPPTNQEVDEAFQRQPNPEAFQNQQTPASDTQAADDGFCNAYSSECGPLDIVLGEDGTILCNPARYGECNGFWEPTDSSESVEDLMKEPIQLDPVHITAGDAEDSSNDDSSSKRCGSFKKCLSAAGGEGLVGEIKGCVKYSSSNCPILD